MKGEGITRSKRLIKFGTYQGISTLGPGSYDVMNLKLGRREMCNVRYDMPRSNMSSNVGFLSTTNRFGTGHKREHKAPGPGDYDSAIGLAYFASQTSKQLPSFGTKVRSQMITSDSESGG